MAYLNAYLGPVPGFGWAGGAEFQTRIVELQNGRNRRNANWAQARHRYSAPFNNISKEAYREVKRMHLACYGQVNTFRFRDQLDYEAVNEIFAIADGVQTEFQLSKFSTVDGISYQREVYALANTPIITANGSPASPTVNMNTGKVVFAVAPTIGATLRWSGIFDIWVRFAQDYLHFSLDNPNATNGTIELIEDDPPES